MREGIIGLDMGTGGWFILALDNLSTVFPSAEMEAPGIIGDTVDFETDENNVVTKATKR